MLLLGIMHTYANKEYKYTGNDKPRQAIHVGKEFKKYEKKN